MHKKHDYIFVAHAYWIDGWELLEELWDEEVDSWELEDPAMDWAAANRFFLCGVWLLSHVVNDLQ